MPGSSSLSLSSKWGSFSSSLIVTSKGISADPPPDPVVGAADLGLVVAGQPQLVGGGEVEVVLAHEPGFERSPPVSSLTSASSRRRPSSTS